jgi:hypothetical protein
MHEKNRYLDDLAETYGSVRRFSFNNWWTRSVVMVGLSHALFFQFLGHPFDYISVLGVYHRGKIVLAACQHDVQQFAIPKLKSFIGHVQFARGDSSLKQFG